jgi:predicted secreted protein
VKPESDGKISAHKQPGRGLTTFLSPGRQQKDHPMDFNDGRGMKVVLVAHCILNQNARLARCAECPCAVTELVQGLLARQIGLIQMPCPELMLLGLDRERIHIRSGLDTFPARAALRAMARDLVHQIRQYQACGIQVLGVLGKNNSPSCGVETSWFGLAAGPGMGVFIEELKAELASQGVHAPMAGTLDAEPEKALAIVDSWLPTA